MKKTLFAILLLIHGFAVFAQLNSSKISIPASAQPVPNATVKEKSATSLPQNIPLSPNPIPPIYPGAEVKAGETQRQLIFPATTPNGTQPVQKEPLSPIETTNNLQPNRPQREEASRENPAVGVPSTTIKSKTIFRKTPVKVVRNVNSSNIENATDKNTISKGYFFKKNRKVKSLKLEKKSVNQKTLGSKKIPQKINSL